MTLEDEIRALVAEPFDVLEVEANDGHVSRVPVVRIADLRALLAALPSLDTAEQAGEVGLLAVHRAGRIWTRGHLMTAPEQPRTAHGGDERREGGTGDVEALAAHLRGVRIPSTNGVLIAGPECGAWVGHLADAVLASDWLAARDAESERRGAEKALRSATGDDGVFIGSIVLMDALFDTYVEHMGAPEGPDAENGIEGYMWCACGWRSDDLDNSNPGLSYAVHLSNALHAASVKALQPVVVRNAGVARAVQEGRDEVISGVRAWCSINEIAGSGPLDWAGLGEFLTARADRLRDQNGGDRG